jgi:KaiC/GvpD/RAD55 family RecA-like ATPase
VLLGRIVRMVNKKILKRSKTHICGFDDLICGGFPLGSSILLSGSPGSGKTIFSLQYLINGALLDKQKGIYFTFEERKESLFLQASQFGWDLDGLEKKGLIKIISVGTSFLDKYSAGEMSEIINSFGAKRVVIDSITTLSFLVNTQNGILSEFEINNYLYSFITKFKLLSNVTLLLISQKEGVGSKVAEFICDGLLNLETESLGGNYSRNLLIKKMRSTKNDDNLHPLEISDEGIKIHSFMKF